MPVLGSAAGGKQRPVVSVAYRSSSVLWKLVNPVKWLNWPESLPQTNPYKVIFVSALEFGSAFKWESTVSSLQTRQRQRTSVTVLSLSACSALEDMQLNSS